MREMRDAKKPTIARMHMTIQKNGVSILVNTAAAVYCVLETRRTVPSESRTA